MRLILALMVGLVCCDGREPPSLANSPVVDSQQRTAPTPEEKDRARAILARFSPGRFDAPRRRERLCQDIRLDAEPVQLVADVRLSQKRLLPLSIRAKLSHPDLSQLEAALAGMKGARAALQAVKKLERLAAQRHVVVVHVSLYSPPRRIHRLGRRRAEWVPGMLEAWLSVHDQAVGQPLCQSRLFVRNKVDGAPTAIRHRSRIREHLTQDLGTDMARQVRTALHRLREPSRRPVAAVTRL